MSKINQSFSSPNSTSIEAIPPGKLKCIIKGILRKDTKEERVRQDVARSLVEEYGYEQKDIDIEFPIKMGSAKKRVDIAVFSKDKNHEQKNVYIIIEVKSEDVKPSNKINGIDQLESYVAACPNTKFALWVGNERIAFKVEEHEGIRKISHIPDIPISGMKTIPKPTRGSLVPAIKLKQVFKRIHNYIYANQGFQKDKAFEELLKLIFVKVYDEQFSSSLQFYILPDEDISNIRQRISNVFKNVQARYKYIYKGNETIELNDRVLEYVISELQRFSFIDTETDVKGEAYEELVGPNLRGDRGEFFTPRNVCNMTIDIIFSLLPEKKLSSPGGIKILDPASGTGGFLISCVHKIKNLFITRGFKHDRLRDLVRNIAENNFFGIDFNPFLVNVAQMNMVMHGDGSANVVHANSLEDSTNWNADARKKINIGEFDAVITNPPFGTKALISNPDILELYEIPKIGNKSALPPEQLFIERCLHFLKPGGYLGIVLPDSILSNPGLSWLREWIQKKTIIIASIDLPKDTFQPYTGTQTSVLILCKKETGHKDLSEDYEIFMAIPGEVGHDKRGNPVYKTTPEGELVIDEKGQPIINDHLPIVAELFRDWVKNKGLDYGKI